MSFVIIRVQIKSMTDERGNFYYNTPPPLRYPSNPATAIFTSAQTYNNAPGYVPPATAPTTRDNKMDTSRSNSTNSVAIAPYNKSKEPTLDAGESIWYNKCVDFVQKLLDITGAMTCQNLVLS